VRKVLQSGIARRRSGTAAALLLACAVGALALPSAVLAFSSRFDPAPDVERQAVKQGGFMPAEVDPRLARSITVRALARGAFRFTPAATPNRLERSVTVAVRFDGRDQRSIVVTGPLAKPEVAPGGGSTLRIAPTAYSLGATRGYKGFGQGMAASQSPNRRPELPDLSSYQLSGSTARPDPSRFAPRIALDEKEKAGRSPRTFEGESDQSVDLGGSYRLTRNINVTAGVRYQTERDRLVPLTDGKKDSQAVYVGTQFRF
jgi:hypothetical protein